MTTSISSSTGDYTILPITMPPTPAFNVSTTHHIYLRPHAPKISSPSDSRTLFLVNVPTDSTEPHLRSVFTQLVGAGRLERLTFDHDARHSAKPAVPLPPAALTQHNPSGIPGRKRKRAGRDNDNAPSSSSSSSTDESAAQLPEVWDRRLRHSGGTALAVMVDERSVQSVLAASRKVRRKGGKHTVLWTSGGDAESAKAAAAAAAPPPLGSARYRAHHALRYPAHAALQASIDAFMAAFNDREAAAAAAARRARNEPDDDGWVTVTRGSTRTAPARREEAEEKLRAEKQGEAKRREEMGDFYRFQGRERRKREQGELVRRFEEDRRKVEKLKEKRGRFRPE